MFPRRGWATRWLSLAARAAMRFHPPRSRGIAAYRRLAWWRSAFASPCPEFTGGGRRRVDTGPAQFGPDARIRAVIRCASPRSALTSTLYDRRRRDSLPRRKQFVRHSPKNQCLVFVAGCGELLESQAQRIVIAFASADGGIVTAPHHSARAEHLMRCLQQRWDRQLKWERSGHGEAAPAEFSQSMDFDVDVGEARQFEDAPPMLGATRAGFRGALASEMFDDDPKLGESLHERCELPAGKLGARPAAGNGKPQVRGRPPDGEGVVPRRPIARGQTDAADPLVIEASQLFARPGQCRLQPGDANKAVGKPTDRV